MQLSFPNQVTIIRLGRSWEQDMETKQVLPPGKHRLPQAAVSDA